MRRKYDPYVRRANGSEMAESLRIAFRLAYYQLRGKPFFVMVQRGFPNLAIEVGASKREVQQQPLSVNIGRLSFKQWAKQVGAKARGQHRST